MTAEVVSATWPEAAGDPRTLVVPVGSLEQHGPHLPLDTDTQVAVALTKGMANLRDVPSHPLRQRARRQR